MSEINRTAAPFPLKYLDTLDHMRAVEQLQRQVWDSPSTVIYPHMLLSFARNGCPLIGAFDNNRLIGFLLGFLALESPEADRPAMANLKLASQRMAILPEYRDSGVGYALKLEQRSFAMKQGIRLITWTFDPLQTRNAHFNIRKLGSVVREYLVDHYGNIESPLVTAGTSDRITAEWWVTNNRVEQRLNGKRNGLTIAQYLDGNAAIINPARFGDEGLLHPTDTLSTAQNTLLMVQVPDNYNTFAPSHEDLAKTWRAQIRATFTKLLGSNYMITDFVRGQNPNNPDDPAHAYYVFSYADATIGRFSTN